MCRNVSLFPHLKNRLANFMRSAPLKRDRSPLSQRRSSPSPKKRYVMDDINNAGRSPSRDGRMNTPDSGRRRNAAKSVPPKIFHQKIFWIWFTFELLSHLMNFRHSSLCLRFCFWIVVISLVWYLPFFLFYSAAWSSYGHTWSSIILFPFPS